MNAPHDEDETEPGDVMLVVCQAVMGVPFDIWIKFVTKLALYL